jgi:hypothetical protein
LKLTLLLEKYAIEAVANMEQAVGLTLPLHAKEYDIGHKASLDDTSLTLNLLMHQEYTAKEQVDMTGRMSDEEQVLALAKPGEKDI